jgi:UPF0755 protein
MQLPQPSSSRIISIDNMRKVALFVLMLLIAAGAGAWVLYGRVSAPFKGYTAADQLVEIPPGLGTRAIGERLVMAGVIRDPLTYRLAVWWSGDARRLQAGEYRFDRPMTALDVVGKTSSARSRGAMSIACSSRILRA